MCSKIKTGLIWCSLISLMFLCAVESINAQEPVKVEKELPPPPPPPPPPSESEVAGIFEPARVAFGFQGCEGEQTFLDTKQCTQEKILECIYSRLEYPEKASEQRLEGVVIVQFYIDKDGSVGKAELIKDIGAGCGEEVLRVVKSLSKVFSRKWSRGKSHGKPVKTYFKLPIEFELDKIKQR